MFRGAVILDRDDAQAVFERYLFEIHVDLPSDLRGGVARALLKIAHLAERARL